MKVENKVIEKLVQAKMQTFPKSNQRLYKIKVALHHWLIKIGLEPSPVGSNSEDKQLSGEQEQAQIDLRMHQQRKPRYW